MKYLLPLIVILSSILRAGPVEDAISAGATSVPEVLAYLETPVPISTNVVTVSRPAGLVAMEANLNALATSYVSQETLDSLPSSSKAAAVFSAVSTAQASSSGETRAAHIANGSTLFFLASATADAGGGFLSPYYRQSSYQVTNVVTATRWASVNGTNAIPSRLQIRASLLQP